MKHTLFICRTIAFLAIGMASECYGAATNVNETFEHLPAPVQQTIRTHLAKGRLRSIDIENENGDITYDVEMVGVGGRARSFTVGAAGELLDKELFVNELPMPVRQAVKKKAGTAVIGDINRSYENGDNIYDIEIVADGKTRSFTLDEKGELMEEEVFLSELPEAVQAAIRKETAGKPMDEITRNFDDGEISYDVDIVANQKTRTFTFDANGAMVSSQEDVALAEVPEAAQKQIQSFAATGKVLTIQKVTETNTVSYDVDIRQVGKVKSYSITADGKVADSDEQQQGR
jgi:uncharacterized membrane protein YkoI